MGPKIDVMEREWKNSNFSCASKQGARWRWPVTNQIKFAPTWPPWLPPSLSVSGCTFPSSPPPPPGRQAPARAALSSPLPGFSGSAPSPTRLLAAVAPSGARPRFLALLVGRILGYRTAGVPASTLSFLGVTCLFVSWVDAAAAAAVLMTGGAKEVELFRWGENRVNGRRGGGGGRGGGADTIGAVPQVRQVLTGTARLLRLRLRRMRRHSPRCGSTLSCMLAQDLV
jgi:hypothetical protein